MNTIQLNKNTWNMTVDEFKNYQDQKSYKRPEDFVTPKEMPNGVYRMIHQLFNDNDTVGFTIHHQFEKYLRLNDENF